MDESKSGMAWGGIAFLVIFVLLIIAVFFNRGRGGEYAEVGNYRGGKGEDCITDKDIYKQNCEYQEEAKECKINELNAKVNRLETEKYVDCQTDKVMGAVGHVAHQVERLDCECLKRPPVWGEAVVACGREINERGGCGCGRGFRGGDRD